MPYFRELEKELADPDLAFLSVCVGASPEKDLWLKLVNDHHLSGNVVFVDSWTRGFAEDYKVTSVPRFIIIDRQGRVYSCRACAQVSSTESNDSAGIGSPIMGQYFTFRKIRRALP